MNLVLPEKARILVAEDHPLNQLFARRALERFGVGYFEIVADGLQAVRQYQTGHWDAILMDCHMPEMTGYDATQEIRALEKGTGSHVFIIAMTANTMEDERKKCLACGMDEYLSKPVNIGEFKWLLARRLKFEDAKTDWTENKPVQNNQAPVDFTMLQAHADKDATVEKEMVRLFIEQSEKNISAIKKSQQRKVYTTLKETAHMLKGGASLIGAMELARLCDNMEHFEGTDGGRAALVDAVAKEYGRVKHHLEELGLLKQGT